ncbi:unnamed protein product [Trichobilharzia regenti]|nr:unnamed protein product [Trichobilharzia regenti]
MNDSLLKHKSLVMMNVILDLLNPMMLWAIKKGQLVDGILKHKKNTVIICRIKKLCLELLSNMVSKWLMVDVHVGLDQKMKKLSWIVNYKKFKQLFKNANNSLKKVIV